MLDLYNFLFLFFFSNLNLTALPLYEFLHVGLREFIKLTCSTPDRKKAINMCRNIESTSLYLKDMFFLERTEV